MCGQKIVNDPHLMEEQQKRTQKGLKMACPKNNCAGLGASDDCRDTSHAI